MAKQNTAEKRSVVAVLTVPTLLRYILQGGPEESTKATAWLADIERGEVQTYLPEAAIFEAVTALEAYYHVPKPQICERFQFLLSLEHLVLADKSLMSTTFHSYQDYDLNFPDASLVALMKRQKITEIASDNPAFDRIPGIRRLRP